MQQRHWKVSFHCTRWIPNTTHPLNLYPDIAKEMSFPPLTGKQARNCLKLGALTPSKWEPSIQALQEHYLFDFQNLPPSLGNLAGVEKFNHKDALARFILSSIPDETFATNIPVSFEGEPNLSQTKQKEHCLVHAHLIVNQSRRFECFFVMRIASIWKAFRKNQLASVYIRQGCFVEWGKEIDGTHPLVARFSKPDEEDAAVIVKQEDADPNLETSDVSHIYG